MTQVEFEEQNDFSRREESSKEQNSFLVGLVIKTGLAKDASQANIILIILAVVFFALTFLVFFK